MQNHGRDPDLLWKSRNITIWTVTECNIGIIAGNLLCFKPLFRDMLGLSYGSRTTPTSYAAGTGRATSNHTYGVPYGGNDIPLSTKIGASKGLVVDDASDARSTESQEAFAKTGGITKTTEVNVVGGTNINESSEDMSATVRRLSRVV
jgi:hypothetical protein